MKSLLFLPIYYSLATIILPFITTLFLPNDTPSSPPPVVNSAEISVFNHETQNVTTMTMEDYLTGVVAAEMPAAFETEALKAQAVAARTYTMYKKGSNDHDADVCTDHSHCQAYLSEEKMRTNWGEAYDFYLSKVKACVLETRGEILTYNDEPILAVFHSMGGGQTVNSGDVWGSQLPYLVSVPSPGEEVGTNYYSTHSLPFEEFAKTIKTAYPEAEINSFLDVSVPTLSESGHVKSVLIGKVSVPGTEIRKLFNLRSTKFTLTFSEGNVTFNVTGYGHGVGMSQYGANAMAKEGKTYKEILSHYYQGATLTE
ncbi:MAG: stage II sporulation protein D [Clostridia bacterium]|nr:stage II sporulation protein D [Clostridia bacterium]